MNRIYTIGYSSFSIDDFISVLQKNGINAVADVRTTPFSQYKPEFNQDLLSKSLRLHGIYYIPLGKECGARPDDKSCYIDNKVSFAVLAKTNSFCHGLQRLRYGLDKCTIGIMCAEQDPINCHRYILVAHELNRHYPEIEILNILRNGILEKTEDTELRLLKHYGLDVEELPGLGKSLNERLAEAYSMQGYEISYQEKDISQAM